jgi:hypothetical protein
MTDFERTLRALEIDWPPTPEIELELAPRRRSRSRMVVAVALVAAVAAAFAVPQSRSAILRLFHLGGVTVVQVETLPPAAERPLAAGLGSQVSDSQAERTLGARFLPARHGTLYEQNGFVSTLLAEPEPMVLSEFGSAYLIKKFAAGNVESVEVEPGVPGLWIAGEPHVVFFPGASPRLAGSVLVWVKDGITFRLEGHGLDQESALRLARGILGTGSS